VTNQTQAREDEIAPLPRVLSLAVHELRTPVTVVAGYIRMLLREQGGPLTDKQRKMLEEADRSCGRIGALVSEMSEFGKLESRELGLARMPFDLAALVAETAAGMGDDSRGVHVEARGADRPVMVTGDRVRIGTAVRALIHASVRERAEAGVVVAECSIVDTWGVVAVGDDAWLPGLVRSAGGAPPGFDEWRGGMGLSLPVGKRVVESQGGAVWSIGEGPQRASGLRLPLVP
jgi:signal transduction histidine kinase